MFADTVKHIRLCEVGLRDGLQNEKKFWSNFVSYINEEWAVTLAVNMVLAMITFGISKALEAILNATPKHLKRSKYFKLANRGQSSTGRRIPLNLKESLAMEQAMSNPLDGTVLPINMSDIRWPSSEGWIKMQQMKLLKNIVSVALFVEEMKH